MNIAHNTLVAIRFRMTNSQGDVLEDTLTGEPVRYIHGAGTILPKLETELLGCQAGDRRNIYLDKDPALGLDEDFRLDVVIDSVRLATEAELQAGGQVQSTKPNECGPGCCC